ncbi:MAG: hypothetical protein U0804_06240 [Gemmataceae bacterium]
MKIGCHCGAVIVDQTDDLPYKGYLIPDEDFYAVFDALDDQVINPVAGGSLDREAAYHLARRIIGRPARRMWQCVACGRLYIDDHNHQLRCFVPADDEPDRAILRGSAIS